MNNSVPLAEIWRGEFLESLHLGHVAIAGTDGTLREVWGDAEAVILPRSSVKMIQALPLVTSGAAEVSGLTDRHLALACASHQGAPIHTDLAQSWLAAMGLSEDDLLCGPHLPPDIDTRNALIRRGDTPCQIHNNCSGKHTGFLTLGRHLRAGPDYIDAAHPVQKACREAFEMTTDQPSPGFGVDGCSAPNFATTLGGLARAMGWFAGAAARPDLSSRAADRLVSAMMTHPELVAGEGRACTQLMRAARGRAAVKTGAEGVFVGILPEAGLGFAIKAADGATRAAECATAALLVRLGVLDAKDPAVLKRMNAPIRNRRGIETGQIRPASGLLA